MLPTACDLVAPPTERFEAPIQLDDAPNETLTYTISDAARPDVEEELPAAARVSELSTGAATGQK